MNIDYPNREYWLAIRKTLPRPVRYIHVSGFGRIARRSLPFNVATGVTRTVRREKRPDKKARMAAKYKAFFADPKMRARIEELSLAWAVRMNPRLVRDTVLGSAKS